MKKLLWFVSAAVVLGLFASGAQAEKSRLVTIEYAGDAKGCVLYKPGVNGEKRVDLKRVKNENGRMCLLQLSKKEFESMFSYCALGSVGMMDDNASICGVRYRGESAAYAVFYGSSGTNNHPWCTFACITRE